MQRPLLDLSRKHPELADRIEGAAVTCWLALALELRDLTNGKNEPPASTDNVDDLPGFAFIREQVDLLFGFLREAGLDPQELGHEQLLVTLNRRIGEIEADLNAKERVYLLPLRGARWYWRTLNSRNDAPEQAIALSTLATAARAWSNILLDLQATFFGIEVIDRGEKIYKQAAKLYEKGRRKGRIRTLFEQAAIEGNVDARRMVGVLKAVEDGNAPGAEEEFRAAALAGDSQSAFNLGRLLADQPDRAVELEQAYRLAIALGSIPAVNNLAAWLGERTNRQHEAIELFEMATHLPDAATAHFNLGLLLAPISGREGDAEAELRQAIKGEINEARFWLGVLLQRMPGRQQEAESYFRAAAEAGMSKALLALAIFEGRHKERIEEAVTHARAANEAGHADALNLLGALEANRGHVERAEAAFREAVSLGVPDADYNLGLLLSKEANRQTEAEKYLGDALANGNSNALNDLGLLLLNQPGRLQEAEQYLLRAVEIGDQKALNNLGLLYTRRRDYASAERVFRAALEQGVPGMAKNYGNLLAGIPGRESEAESFYEQAFEEGDVGAAYNLGLLLQREDGRVRDAANAFAAALTHGHAEASRPLAWLLASAGDVKAAESVLVEGIRAGDVHAYNLLGLILANDGDVDKAVKVLEVADRMGVPDAAFNLAGLMLQLGEFGKAEQLYRKAIADGDIDGHNALGVLLTRWPERWNEAMAEFRIAISSGIKEAEENLRSLLSRRGNDTSALSSRELLTAQGHELTATDLSPDFQWGKMHVPAVLFQFAKPRSLDLSAA